MERDDLKGAWKQQSQQTATKLLSADELLAMISSKATNSVDSLKRSVLFELWSTVLFLVVCMVFGFTTTDDSVGQISMIAAFLSCGFGYYYYKKLSLLKNLNIESKPIKETLTDLITQFEKFLWFYRWGYNILIPFALFIGAFAGFNASSERDLIQIISDIRLWITLTTILVPIAFLCNFVMKWYLKKLYGSHLTRLRSILGELQG
jgi:hypothetical protein